MENPLNSRHQILYFGMVSDIDVVHCKPLDIFKVLQILGTAGGEVVQHHNFVTIL